MSDLQLIGAEVTSVAADLGAHASNLAAMSAALKRAAQSAAAAARGAEGGAAATAAVVRALEAAAQHCSRAAQQLGAGQRAAQLFVQRNVISGNPVGAGSTARASVAGAVWDLPDISTAQSEFIGAQLTTRAGACFFYPSDQEYRSASNDVPEYPGEYVVDVHGESDAVALRDSDENCHRLDAKEFAEVLRRTGWSGQPIRLFSCNTGARDNGIAQQLADQLGVPVVAPTAPVWSRRSAFGQPLDPVVTDGHWAWNEQRQTYDWLPVYPETGSWRTFTPVG